MALLDWDVRLETGHPTIDGQHKSLIKIINKLHAAMKAGQGRAEIENILVFLKDYTVSHFCMEEALMDQNHYPGAVKHKQIHSDLVKQVAELVDNHQKGALTMTMPVMDFLQSWLTAHIQGEDFRLAEFLRNS